MYKKPKDAAAREAQFVQPIRFDKKSDTPTIKKSIKENLIRKNSHKVEPNRENKEVHQHTFDHDKIYRKTIPKNSV